MGIALLCSARRLAMNITVAAFPSVSNALEFEGTINSAVDTSYID